MFIGGGRAMGSGGGGAGGGGSGMLRTVGRTIARAGVTNLQDPISSSSSSSTSPTAASRHTGHKLNSSINNNTLSISSSGGSALSVSQQSHLAVSNWGDLYGNCECDYDWVDVDGIEEEERLFEEMSDGGFVFGPAPSVGEVHTAVSALTKVFDAPPYSQLVRDKFPTNVEKTILDQVSSPTGLQRDISKRSELDWVEPSLQLHDPRLLHPCASDRVYDALHLLQTESSVQRMVISLSSDKAVWDAVLNNEVVRELRETYYSDGSVTSLASERSAEGDVDREPAVNIIKWIFDNAKAKFLELIDGITKLATELFKLPDDEKTAAGAKNPFEERLRTSFLLSIVVLLIVVVSRNQKA